MDVQYWLRWYTLTNIVHTDIMQYFFKYCAAKWTIIYTGGLLRYVLDRLFDNLTDKSI